MSSSGDCGCHEREVTGIELSSGIDRVLKGVWVSERNVFIVPSEHPAAINESPEFHLIEITSVRGIAIVEMCESISDCIFRTI